jgi:carbonic anhydrase
VRAALERTKIGLIDNWLRHVQDVHLKHSPRVEPLATHEERLSRLCELNVIEQTRHVCETTIVHDAWARGRPVAVHAWIYSLAHGLLHDLGFPPSAASEVSRGTPRRSDGYRLPVDGGRYLALLHMYG